MICPVCLCEISGEHLACPACLEKRSWTDARILARRHLAAILTGRLEVRLVAKGHLAPHIALPDHFGAYCGVDLRDHNLEKPKLKRLREARDETICQACVAALDAMAKQETGL